MLLNLSETLAHIGDWLSVHFAELGGAISIPVVIWFLAKLGLTYFRNKQAIKSATLDAVKNFNNDINVLNNEIKTRFNDLERNIENKIDGKFEELKEKRKEIYNNIMAGVDKIETKRQEVVEKAEETINEVAEEIVLQVEKLPEVAEINADDILR